MLIVSDSFDILFQSSNNKQIQCNTMVELINLNGVVWSNKILNQKETKGVGCKKLKEMSTMKWFFIMRFLKPLGHTHCLVMLTNLNII